MRRIVLSLLILAIGLLTASCGVEEGYTVRSAAEYEEKILEVKLPLQVTVDSENCDLEVYRWIRKEVKFEYKESVSGKISEEELTAKLKHFHVEMITNDNEVTFKSSFNSSGKISGNMVLRVYLPKKTERFEFICDKGTLRAYDDMEGELVIKAGKLDAEVNSFKGRLECSIKEGDFRLKDGELSDESIIATGLGNVRVKARYKPSGTYNFISKEGLLDIFIPSNLNVRFTEDLPQEYTSGEYLTENFYETKSGTDESDKYTANFKLESGLDMIRITRF